mmetsp:Transcript_18552/g.30584  ORF Transcript_18552/g.30584 Transcript_18552/m.30584 type:complete len:218 (-) Transcript_18552:840-1493(-)
MPMASKRPMACSSTTSGRAPTSSNCRSSVLGSTGTIEARQASSPWVNVVSIPEPEKFNTRTDGAWRWVIRSAALARSSLITSEGQEPTRNNCLMSGRRARSSSTTLSSSSWASARPARSVSSRIAVPKRGSAKIITPAADWRRWAQVREPTTKKNASCILRCSQMIPVRPQNTSRWPRCLRIGVSRQPPWLGRRGSSVMREPHSALRPEAGRRVISG